MGRFIGRKILGVLLLAGMIAAGLTGCKKADGPKDEYDCFISMDDAKVEAEKKNLPILVTVTVEESERDGMEAGSKYYLENILGTKEFKDYADNHFVLYRFDFSQKSYEKTVAPENASDKEKAEADKYAQYMKEGYMLASILGVQYTPSIFILTKEGYPVSEVEYFEDSLSADGFIKILETYADKTQFLNDMLSATKKGSNEEKLKAIEALYSTTPDMWQIFLLDLAKQAIKLDPDNKSGEMGKYVLAVGEDEAANLYNEQKFQEAAEKYIELAQHKFMTPELAQQCYYMAAWTLASTGSAAPDVIMGYLNNAVSVAPDSENTPLIYSFMEYFQSLFVTSDAEAE